MFSLFLVLGLSSLAVACVSAAIYLRIRRHLRSSPGHEVLEEMKGGPEARDLH
jgi:hypothetical protein